MVLLSAQTPVLCSRYRDKQSDQADLFTQALRSFPKLNSTPTPSLATAPLTPTRATTHCPRAAAAYPLPALVLDIVRLVKDEDVVLNPYVRTAPYGWVQHILVWRNHQLSTVSDVPSDEIRAHPSALAKCYQVLHVMHLGDTCSGHVLRPSGGVGA